MAFTHVQKRDGMIKPNVAIVELFLLTSIGKKYERNFGNFANDIFI